MSARTAYEYNLRNWSDIQAHLAKLFDGAQGECLEIGVRSGVSTSAILAGLEERGGFLHSVDMQNCPIFEGHPQWQFIQSDSVKCWPELLQVLPGSLDMLFVDGDHTYEGALSDLRHFGVRAKTIFVHDTDAPDFPGVRQAVEQYCDETKRPVIYYGESYGMAEIR